MGGYIDLSGMVKGIRKDEIDSCTGTEDEKTAIAWQRLFFFPLKMASIWRISVGDMYFVKIEYRAMFGLVLNSW